MATARIRDTKVATLRQALLGVQVAPTTVVETGTFRGQFTLRLPELFQVVHTVELSARLFATHPDDLRINWHHGDSAEVVAKLAVELKEPVLWYLDAHYFAGADAAESFPLWRELRAISARSQPDIVVVDDVHTFGKQRDKKYGPWHAVTPKALVKALGRVTGHCQIKDAYVMYRGKHEA